MCDRNAAEVKSDRQSSFNNRPQLRYPVPQEVPVHQRISMDPAASSNCYAMRLNYVKV